MTLPRVDPFLRIVPDAYERDFWHSSQQHRRLASSLDWWSLWFTCINCLLLLRYTKLNKDMLAEARVFNFWCSILLLAALAQAIWRLVTPSHYNQRRFRVLLFNRTTRLLSFIDLLSTLSAAFAHPAQLAAQRRGAYLQGPFRAFFVSSPILQPFVHSCNTILPFRLHAAFQAAYFTLFAISAPSVALRLLGDAPQRPAPHRRPHTPSFAPLNGSLFCTAPAPFAIPRLHSSCVDPEYALLQQLAPRPPGFHRGIQDLCTTLSLAMRPFHISSSPSGPGASCHMCQAHAVAVLVLFFNILLTLLVPIFIAYRFEQHAKSLYIRDVYAGSTPLPAGVDLPATLPPSWNATAVPCLPHWADLVSLALLTIMAWQAAAELHGLTASSLLS